MQKSERVSRIDNFKWIAALLVAANHTSPLESINATADFLLTRVAARLAVPFFFMVTGYFVLSSKGVLHSIRKTVILYLEATILYLPIQLYKFVQGINKEAVQEAAEAAQQLGTTEAVQGAAGMEIIGNVLKATFFDGTYYHLWYLPAVILGIGIVILLLKYIPGQAMAVAAILYGAGLLGDSYYGAVAGIPLLKRMYDGLFTVFSYTRNGLFMAPLFLLLGRKIAVNKEKDLREQNGDESLKAVRHLRNFILTFAFMCVEGLILYKGDMQRHDSMYLILPICMWYLFSYLTDEGKNAPLWERTFFYEGPMIFYIVHPLAILVVRGFVKITKLQFLLTISPLYYLAVVGCGLLGTYAVLLLRKYFKKLKRGYKRCI
ncbi:MAG: acyltransferase family protein [Lachnospiraceae bacterium]